MKYETQEAIIKRHSECFYTCQFPECTEPSTQIAHKISKGKAGRQNVKGIVQHLFGYDLTGKQIDLVIHHRYNTEPCCARHNDYYNLHISQTEKVKELVVKIFTEMLMNNEI